MVETKTHNFWNLAFRLKGTVLIKVWSQGLFMILYTALICVIHNYVDGVKVDQKLSIMSIIGFVTSLLLVFRTNTAYDRYWEGRKLWAKLTSSIRSLTLGVWAGVEESENELESKEIISRISFLNLLVAFAFATKNYLRGEYSYDDDEQLKILIGHLPRFQTPSSNESLTAQTFYRPKEKSTKKDHSEIPLDEGSNPDGGVQEKINEPNGVQKEKFSEPPSRRRCMNMRAYDRVTPSNIPYELSFYLVSHFRNVGSKQIKDHSFTKEMYHSLFALVDCLTGFERILRTPIPLAYSVHLHYVVWLYLLTLPYQLVGQLNWLTIPVVALASWALLGILWIGWEIENPFGYDYNDLPLDDFCKVLQKEVQMIIRNPLPKLDDWLMSPYNYPLAHQTSQTAAELSKMSGAELVEILAKKKIE